MKLALLLPGYLDSPDYQHLMIFEKRLKELGYVVERLDPCHLWETGDVNNYSITNFIKQIRERVEFYKEQKPQEVVLIGHSMGAFTAIIAGSRIDGVTKIVALCPPPDRYGSAKEWKGTGLRRSIRDLPNDPAQHRAFDVPYSYVEDGIQYSARDEVKNLNKPLMIFIALDDEVVPPKLTEEIIANANNPYVVRQKKMGHDFRYSIKECNIVMAKIERFLIR